MNTKFDINQTVLIKAQVKQIRIEENGEKYYFVSVRQSDARYFGDMDFAVAEKEIVCGWIRREND